MAQLAIAAAGAAVGFAIPGVGPAIGWAVGSMVGAQFGPKQKSYGPRLEDLKVTGAEYGQTIPWAAGHPRIAGQVWWASQRREIATTTSAGKGGGGAESTSYSYEVDILFGLVNRPITAVTRIWSNGKLIYTNLGLSDDDSLANSADNPNWDRLTVYTGAADQLPDPTYEAAVTNAPAYRGRGSVFIEGLQLGNSGVIPNLTFEVAIDADETPSEMQLLCNFEDGSTADVSPYLLGDAAENGPGPLNFSDGTFSFTQKISDDNRVSWTAPGLKVQSQPLTVEFIFRVDAITPSPPTASIKVARYIPNSNAPGDYWNFNLTGAISGQNRMEITPPGGAAFTVTDNINGRGFPYHVAIVFKADDTYDYYLHGRKVTPSGNGNPPNNAYNATISLGGTGQATQETLNSYYDVRITKQELYTDDFTPPTELGPFTTTFDLVDDTLQNVVEDLCEAAGMPVGTYDATALASITKPVRAFVLSQVATSRSAIEQLMSAYFFEAYVTDKLYFVPRAGSVLGTIDADDMGAGLEAPDDETLPTQVGSDLEIPAQVSVSYSNVDADYTTATEHSDRLLSGQVSTSVVQLPMGFTSAEAKGIADAIVVDGYASRVTGTFSVPLAYAELVPTDVVAVPDADGNVYRVRLVRRTDTGPLLQFEWVLDDATAIESAGITSDDYTSTIDVATPGSTRMELLDIPLMRDSENTLGHVVAATSSGTTWPGASISRSLDNVEFTEAARVSERAIMGVTTTTLGNFTGIGFDEVNTVTVRLTYGTLSSSTRAGLLADAAVNNMMIGAELVRFRTATFVDDGIYTLSGLLRGQKGTEWAMASHTSADVAVLIQTAGLRYVTIDLPSLSAERFYKGVTLGRSLASVTSEAFTCEGVSLKPLAPVNLRKSGNADSGLTITWDRRTRLACTFTGAAGISVPLGELTEAYEVDLLDGSLNVVSTTETTAPSVSLSSAVQSQYLPVGISFVHLYGGNYFGATVEGSGYSQKWLVEQTPGGTEVARLFLGNLVDWGLVEAGHYFAKIQEVNTAGTPAFTVKNSVYRIPLSGISGGYTQSYDCTSLADYGQIAHDGTYLWVTEPDSENLVQLNGTSLAVVATHSMPGVEPGAIAYDSTSADLFFGDSAGFVHELVRWDIAGTAEVWRVSSTARVSCIGVRGALVFAACDDGRIRVFAVSDGSLVQTHSVNPVGRQNFPLLGGDVLAYANVPTLGDCVLLFDVSTGELLQTIRPAVTGIFGGVTGSDIWISYGVVDFTNYDAKAFEIGADFAGYTARVYQMSAVVGRGYPASIAL